MKFSSFLIFILIVSNALFAQERPDFQYFEGYISGKVIDEQSKKPMPYANVSVFRMKDSTLAGGGITDDNGFFKIEKLKPGFYKIKIDFIGYDRYVSTAKVTPQNPSVSMGTIMLKPAVTQLGEVEVKSEKPMVEFKLDKKVINVDKNIVTSGGNATDILRNIPSVQVDMDGNVSLRGSTNVTILIDGKPSTLSSADKAAILEQIPASTIERIEIITNPSAKYDPEGMAGILNIVTKQEKRQGINGLFTLNYGTMKKFGGTLSINRRVNKTNLFFSYDYRSDERNGYRNHDRYLYINDTLISHTLINSIRQNKNFSHNIKGGFDLNFNHQNSLNFTATYRIGDRTGYDYAINKLLSSANTLTKYYQRDEKSANPSDNIDVSLGYKKKFDEPMREFTTDLFFSWDENNIDENYYQYNFVPVYFSPLQKSNSYNTFTNLTFQSDYVHPASEKTRIDAGIKAMMRTSDNNYFFYNYDLTEFKKDTNLSNHFVYSDYVYSGYAMLSQEWKKISMQIGLRAEETIQNGNQKTSRFTFKRNYFSLFPTTHISYNLPNDNKIQVSYSRRINRPHPHSINPFIDKSDPLTWHMGNPDLKPEYINSYEMGHIKDWKKISLTSQAFYKTTNNVISRYRKTDTTGIITIYPINMSKAESYGLEFIVNTQPTKFMRIMGTFSYYNTKIIGSDGDNDLTNSILSYDAKFNASFFLPKSFSIQVDGMFYGPSVMAQATRTSFYTVDAGFRKELWNRKASLSLRISDIFNTMVFKLKTDVPNLKANMEFKRETRILYITFTYKINEGIKQKERQRQQEMNMDMDMVE
ncbi:MAG: TonB-dependent receptor domain-containing protein [Bacteroidales bacterium]